MLLGDGERRRSSARRRRARRSACSTTSRWPARELALPARWGLLLFTDGLIEGRAAVGRSARLGMEGLIALLAGIDAAASWADEPSALVADLIEDVLERNGGALLDDIAALLLTGGRSAA